LAASTQQTKSGLKRSPHSQRVQFSPALNLELCKLLESYCSVIILWLLHLNRISLIAAAVQNRHGEILYSHLSPSSASSMPHLLTTSSPSYSIISASMLCPPLPTLYKHNPHIPIIRACRDNTVQSPVPIIISLPILSFKSS